MPAYAVTDAVGDLPWPEAFGINNNDKVVGDSWSDDASECLAWYTTTLGDAHPFSAPSAWKVAVLRAASCVLLSRR